MPTARRTAVVCRLLGAALAGAACSGAAEQPEPTALSKESALVDPPKRPERTGPFRNPNVDPPAPRGGAQLPDAELEAALAEAKKHVDAGDGNRAILALRTCANKVPASARCDGEMGIQMLKVGSRKAHGVYHLDEAAKTDDPKADAAFYRRVAQEARRYGRHATAASAMAKVLSREPDGADDWVALSRALQADEARIEEAIQALDRALELDPGQHALRFERAVLTAQTADTLAAIAAFEDFVAKAPADDPAVATANMRLAELKRRVDDVPGAEPSGPGATKPGASAKKPAPGAKKPAPGAKKPAPGAKAGASEASAGAPP